MKDNHEFYEYLDGKETKLLKKINLLVELSKKQYKDKLIEEVKKSQFSGNGFVISNDKFKSVAANMFGSIEELNILAYKDIGSHYYDIGIQQVRELYEDESKKVITKEYTSKVFETMISGFIMGNGLNYNYKQELEHRMEYFNTQMANATMTAVNRKINIMAKDQVKKEYSKVVDEVSPNNSDIVQTAKVQKRSIGKFTDAVGVFIASKSVRQAYEDNGLEYVIRHAEVDGGTCDYCLERDGQIYSLSEVDVPSHYSCRCWIEPIDSDTKIDE